MTVNCSDYLHRRHEAGDEILFEGAQGTHIDIDHGNYPFVTSSNPDRRRRVGRFRARHHGRRRRSRRHREGVPLASRRGPLPTELDGDADEEALADDIREKGGEFGTVTGARPRRIGWLDLPMLRHAARVSGSRASRSTTSTCSPGSTI